MKITPLDIDGHSFLRKFRGYDPEEVRAYLSMVSEEYEKLIVNNHKMHEDVARMQSILDEHRQREKILRETLYTAQKVSEELKEQARREAKILMQEAQLKADQLLADSQGRAVDLESSLVDLRSEKHGFFLKVRAILEQHLKLLEIHEGEAGEDEKLHFLKRREEAGNDA